MKTLNRLLQGSLLTIALGSAQATPVLLDRFLFNGSAADSGSNPLTLANHGGVTFNNLGPIGVPGSAAVFSGSNWLRADTGVVGNNVSGSFSVAFWLKTSTTSLAGLGWWQGAGLVDAETIGETSDWGISLLNNKVAFGIGNLDVTIQSAQTVTDGLWHMVATSWDLSSGAMSLYLDGSLSATGVASTNVLRAGQNRLALGEISTGLGRFTGALADVQVYGGVLSAQEVAALNSPAAIPEPGTLVLAGVAGLALVWSRRPRRNANNEQRTTSAC